MKTEKLLTAGALATPVFFAIALAQAFTRDGFDLSRHMISQLALGDLGWLQIANFVGTDVPFVLGALGLRRALTDGIGHIWIPRLAAVFFLAWGWISLLAASLLPASRAAGVTREPRFA
ncbi:DUF998 domain-containing protein [Nocardia otitidiscaviarum]|uniref:DUF998 domain-containing protein n=1 Tax=Nocardia otitidiscaviarum TaxID=1823 RepID=UPI0024541C44|nr:DUF998 domain-containing protein [Nocardia otitidiscaviarum]